MSGKYSENAAFRINTFVENRLRGIDTLGGAVVTAEAIIPAVSAYVTDADSSPNFAFPFFSPGGQVPEVLSVYSNTTKTFSVPPVATYTVSPSKTIDEPWLDCGQVAYSFYHGDIDKLFEIGSFVKDLCHREDWSAYDINWFYRNDPTNPFDFKHLTFLTGAGPMPTHDEGGYSSLLCVIGYDATYEGTGRVGNYDPAGKITRQGMW